MVESRMPTTTSGRTGHLLRMTSHDRNQLSTFTTYFHHAIHRSTNFMHQNIMDPKPNTRMATMLRYTYRANMVFFAGFAAWYLLKGPAKEETRKELEERK